MKKGEIISILLFLLIVLAAGLGWLVISPASTADDSPVMGGDNWDADGVEWQYEGSGYGNSELWTYWLNTQMPDYTVGPGREDYTGSEYQETGQNVYRGRVVFDQAMVRYRSTSLERYGPMNIYMDRVTLAMMEEYYYDNPFQGSDGSNMIWYIDYANWPSNAWPVASATWAYREMVDWSVAIWQNDSCLDRSTAIRDYTATVDASPQSLAVTAGTFQVYRVVHECHTCSGGSLGCPPFTPAYKYYWLDKDGAIGIPIRSYDDITFDNGSENTCELAYFDWPDAPVMITCTSGGTPQTTFSTADNVYATGHWVTLMAGNDNDAGADNIYDIWIGQGTPTAGGTLNDWGTEVASDINVGPQDGANVPGTFGPLSLGTIGTPAANWYYVLDDEDGLFNLDVDDHEVTSTSVGWNNGETAWNGASYTTGDTGWDDGLFGPFIVAGFSVLTDPATNTGTTTATLSGTLYDMGTETSVAVSFGYGTVSGSYPFTATAAESPMSGTGPFHSNVTGLIPATTYYYQAKGVGVGTAYGNEQNFTTLKTLVTTGAATDVGTSTATLNGNLDYLGVTSGTVSFEYGTQSGSYPYSVVAAESPMNSTGAFHADITGLDYGTTYYYRAKGMGAGIDYGNELNFTTLQSPSVTTNVASNVDCNGAMLNGYLDTVGIPASTDVWFEYGTSDGGPYDQVTALQNMTSPGSFSVSVNLCSETTYYYVAKADNGTGIDTGDQQSFTTDPCLIITTYEVASVNHMDGYGVDDDGDVNGNNPPVWRDLATPGTAALAAVVDSDNTRWDPGDPGNNDESCHWFQFETGQDPVSLTSLDIGWEGYQDGGSAELYIWSYTAGEWGDGDGNNGQGNYVAMGSSGSDMALSGICSYITQYMSGSGQVSLIAYGQIDNERLYTDYVYVQTTKPGTVPYTYTLTTSVTGDGQIDSPASSPANYCGGRAKLESSSTGGTFINWSGDTSTVDDVNSPDTWILMDGNYSVTANYGVAGVTVDIYIQLQGDNRPFPTGWQVPINVGLFPANSGTLVMSGSSAATYWFEGTTSGTVTESGTRAYFQCPTPVNPGTYDITTDSSTTLMNVKREVSIQ